jgi:hypothetical protein
MVVPEEQDASMSSRPLERLLRQVSRTEAEEISCSECFEQLATGVEIELAGAAPTPLWTRLAQHLGQCAVCREEYEVLRELASSEPGDPLLGPGAPPATPPAPAP